MQEAVDVAVGGEARRAGHLVGRVDARAGDADQPCRSCVLLRSSRATRARARRRLRRARAGTPRTRSGRRRCRPLRSRIAGRRRRRRNGVAPTPVSATVSPSGATSAAAPRARSPKPGARPRRTPSPDPAGGKWHDDVRQRAPSRRARSMNGPTRASSSGSSRSPPGERSRSRAPSASRTAGMSEAGSAWAMLPPIVPRFRTCRSPMPSAHSLIAASDGPIEDPRREQLVPGRQRADVELARRVPHAAERRAARCRRRATGARSGAS